MVAATSSDYSDGGFYVALEGGALFATGYEKQQSTSITTVTPTQCWDPPLSQTFNVGSLHDGSGWGGAAGLKGGYNFDSFPACDSLQLRLQPAVEAEALYLGNSDFDAAALFVNGILRFKTSSIITPYLGAGVGAEWVSGLPDSNVGFAVQGLAGVDFAIDKHWSIFTEYHFIDDLSISLQQHVVLAGIKYSF